MNIINKIIVFIPLILYYTNEMNKIMNIISYIRYEHKICTTKYLFQQNINPANPLHCKMVLMFLNLQL